MAFQPVCHGFSLVKRVISNMHDCLQQPVQQLLQGKHLSASAVDTCVGVIMDGACDAVDIAAFLTAMAAKGPVANEVVGAARAMRSRVSGIATSRQPLLDTCGTGGDCLHTFNISTATALVAAACGVNVAKHGNRSVSSSSGSADVLEALGVNINLSAAEAGRCLDEIGIAFCFAPMVHGAMKHAAPVRRQLGFPTIFNLLGPLTNPAGAEHQLLGASSVDRAELLANAMLQLGSQRTLVVCGNDQLDEVCLWGPTTVFDVQQNTIHRCEWTPADFDLPECSVDELTVQSATESAAMINDVLRGKWSAAAAIVTANAAASLVAADRFTAVRDAAGFVRETLASGAAATTLSQLIRFTQRITS